MSDLMDHAASFGNELNSRFVWLEAKLAQVVDGLNQLRQEQENVWAAQDEATQARRLARLHAIYLKARTHVDVGTPETFVELRFAVNDHRKEYPDA